MNRQERIEFARNEIQAKRELINSHKTKIYNLLDQIEALNNDIKALDTAYEFKEGSVITSSAVNINPFYIGVGNAKKGDEYKVLIIEDSYGPLVR